MAITRIDDLKQRIRDALQREDFQASALGLTGVGLTAAVARLLKRRNIGVTLVSVEPAATAALAEFGVVWKSSALGKEETNWFSIKSAKR